MNIFKIKIFLLLSFAEKICLAARQEVTKELSKASQEAHIVVCCPNYTRLVNEKTRIPVIYNFDLSINNVYFI